MMNTAEMPEQTMTTRAPEQHSPTSEYISFVKRQRISAWAYHRAKSNELLSESELVSLRDSIAHMICVCIR